MYYTLIEDVQDRSIRCIRRIRLNDIIQLQTTVTLLYHAVKHLFIAGFKNTMMNETVNLLLTTIAFTQLL